MCTCVLLAGAVTMGAILLKKLAPSSCTPVLTITLTATKIPTAAQNRIDWADHCTAVPFHENALLIGDDSFDCRFSWSRWVSRISRSSIVKNPWPVGHCLLCVALILASIFCFCFMTLLWYFALTVLTVLLVASTRNSPDPFMSTCGVGAFAARAGSSVTKLERA